MTIKQTLIWATTKLKTTSTSPSLDAEVLLCHVLKKPKEFVFSNPDKKLYKTQDAKYKILVSKRVKSLPVAYLTGHKEFYGLDFIVNKHVLAPRPETERIVQLSLDRITNHELPARHSPSAKPMAGGGIRNVIDIGTGSGNIVISLAKSLASPPTPLPNGRGWPSGRVRLRTLNKKRINFYATDISKAALSVAHKNASRHKVKIKFLQGSLLSPFPDASRFTLHGSLLIANLPYLEKVTFSKRRPPSLSLDQKGLRFEPKKSLFAKEKGLRQIRLLLEQISKLKHQPRIILLEFDPRQKTALKKLLKKILPGSKTHFYKDLSDKWRFSETLV